MSFLEKFLVARCGGKHRFNNSRPPLAGCWGLSRGGFLKRKVGVIDEDGFEMSLSPEEP